MFYHHLIDKNQLKNYFNNSFDFLSLKDKDLSWASDFYNGEPYYLVYDINDHYDHFNFVLRVDCTRMRVYADIPKLIDLCEDVLNEGLKFNIDDFYQDEDFHIFLTENNCLLKYKDLVYNTDFIHRVSKIINSIAVVGDLDYNNTICQMIPKISRVINNNFHSLK